MTSREGVTIRRDGSVELHGRKIGTVGRAPGNRWEARTKRRVIPGSFSSRWKAADAVLNHNGYQ